MRRKIIDDEIKLIILRSELQLSQFVWTPMFFSMSRFKPIYFLRTLPSIKKNLSIVLFPGILFESLFPVEL